mgnify:CR=1 FL=1
MREWVTLEIMILSLCPQIVLTAKYVHVCGTVLLIYYLTSSGEAFGTLISKFDAHELINKIIYYFPPIFQAIF